MNLETFEKLLSGLLSEVNQDRKQAEDSYSHLKQFPAELAPFLIHFLKTSPRKEIRNLASVLLRQLLLKAKGGILAFQSLPPNLQEVVKTELLEALKNEPESETRHKISDCIVQVAELVIENGQWPQLLPYLFTCSKSPSEGHRECALTIFSQLVPSIEAQFTPHLGLIKEILLQGLNDPNIQVKLAALDATSSFIQCLPGYHAQFHPLVESMVKVIVAGIQEQKFEAATQALEFFVVLAEVEPKFLQPHLSLLCDTMFAIASNKQLEPGVCHLAIEFFVSLAESKPGALRKNIIILNKLVSLLLQFMANLQEDPEWFTTDFEDEEEESSDMAQAAFDRLAFALGKPLVPILFQILPNLFGSAEWQHRWAGFMTLAVVGEGCEEGLKSHLPDIVNQVLKGFLDPHPRVRWAACNIAGQMATDFAPSFQKKFHSQILPALAATMENKDFPKVQAHAACALINFCENCKPKLLKPYLDGLTQRLTALLHQGNQLAQEQAITAVATVAECAQEHFTNYYDLFMPFLKSVLSLATGNELKKMRGRAMEAATMIGEAVGKQKFHHDAKEIMESLAKTPVTSLEPDDPQITYILHAWSRLCLCLKEDFVPFLPLIMPSLLSAAAIQPDVIGADDESEPPEGFELITVGEENVGIKTSALEEKALACSLIESYASQLKGHFIDYVEPVTQLMIPLINFKYSDEVRVAAIETTPAILVAATQGLEARGKPRSEAASLFHHCFLHLFEAAKKEEDIDLLTSLLQGIHQSIEAVGEGFLNEEKVQGVVELTKKVLNEFMQRRQKREAEYEPEEGDDEDEAHYKLEEENDAEEALLFAVSEINTKLCKFLKVGFLPYFQAHILPLVIPFLAPDRRAHDRQIALCIFDDLVEFIGEPAMPLFPHFVPVMIDSILDIDPGIRQAAVYGIGFVAKIAGPHGASILPEIVNRLVKSIEGEDSRNEDNVTATENAICALGKICLHCPSFINVAHFIPLWLSYLPVTEDVVESKVTYSLLCDFIESSNPHLFGEGGKNLPKIVHVLLECLGSELIEEKMQGRVVNILKQIQNQITPAAVGQLLNDEQKQKWHQFVV